MNVKSAVRVLDLLEMFSVATDPMGVSEASRLLDIPKSSGQALLATLVAKGYLLKTEAGYELNAAYRGTGWVGGSVTSLRKLAEPMLERLADDTGESAFLSVMTPGFEVKYIAKAVSAHVIRYDAPLRGTREAYCSSSGLAILGWLPPDEQDLFLETVELTRMAPATPTDKAKVRALLKRARIDGYAELRDARVVGASGVSAPILDSRRRPIAALSLVAPSSRFDSARSEMCRRVVEGAAELSERIAMPQHRTPSER